MVRVDLKHHVQDCFDAVPPTAMGGSHLTLTPSGSLCVSITIPAQHVQRTSCARISNTDSQATTEETDGFSAAHCAYRTWTVDQCWGTRVPPSHAGRNFQHIPTQRRKHSEIGNRSTIQDHVSAQHESIIMHKTVIECSLLVVAVEVHTARECDRDRTSRSVMHSHTKSPSIDV